MVEGENAFEAFKYESGGHRFQRVPPTERNGRVQTSTITVSILPVPSNEEIRIDYNDLDIKATIGSGPGGQHRNKTASCIIIAHKPTGITVRSESERSQHRNKQIALDILKSRLRERISADINKEINDKRKDQIGSGMRGDKIRTIALQRDLVTDHRLNKSISARTYFEGKLDKFYEE